uniref:Uncharacterized protein n=1 Tax=Arundo donax TaxID=35708 RepID=A0A0A9C2U7_ARUDO
MPNSSVIDKGLNQEQKSYSSGASQIEEQKSRCRS